MEGEGTVYEGPEVQPVTKEEMVGHFRGWEPEAESLMDVSEEKYHELTVANSHSLPASLLSGQ